MYPIIITICLCFAYFALAYLFAAFFEKSAPVFGRRSIFSITCIIVFSLVVYAVSATISDEELSNRILHAFGGGFVSVMVCFFVVRDTRLTISRFQFFIFSLLVVTAMGVANEIFEFFLQNYFHFVVTRSVDDTWLDLISNLVGALIAAMPFTALVLTKKKS